MCLTCFYFALTVDQNHSFVARTSHNVYVCIRDSAYVAKLTIKLRELGYTVKGFSDLREFDGFVFSENTPTPDAIVMSLSFPESEISGIETLTCLRETFRDLPLIICCKQDSLTERLNALRAGATRYFAAPIDTEHLIDTLGDLTGMQPAEPYRVLIIDDDQVSLQIYSEILRDAGAQIFELSDAMEGLRATDNFKPEVIVLDVNMPDISGFELAAVMRERENSRDVPILFLTSDADISTELDALRLGGDAFYVKPIEGNRFKDAVISRAKRFRERVQSRERLDKLLYEREREHHAIDRHALVSVTDIQGRIIDLNDKFCKVSGYSDQELRGQNHRILKSGVHDKDFYNVLWKTITKGETWHGEICNKCKDGSLYWVDSTITPLMDSSGKPYQYVSIRTNITERKNNELKLTEAKQQAEKANQAKSEFLANMSHELRTPLNAIVGFSQLLDSAPDLQDEYRQDVTEIHKAGKHLLGLINDILELAKIESGHSSISTEELLLKPIVSECVSMVMQMALDRGLTFGCDDFDERIKVLGDRTKIRQVMLNLLSNAIKYNRENGAVQIIITLNDDGFVSVTIRDTGIGISEDEIHDLFKPFSRLDAKFSQIEGTGIGLTITREMVERMGGKIGVLSKKDVGSEFWFTLPVVHYESDQQWEDISSEVVDEMQDAERTNAIKVFCVDDNETNLEILKQLFSREPGYKVMCESNPLNAMEQIIKNKPDIVLLDIHMPYLDGYELLKLLKAESQLQGLKVIALTAAALEHDREKGMRAGFYNYLTKPLDYNLLKQVINQSVNDS